MIRAIVFETDAPFRPEGCAVSPIPPDTRLAGLTLVRRAILQAWHLGAQHVTLVTGSPEAAAHWAQSEKELHVPLTVVGRPEDLPRFDDDDRVLLLSPQVMAAKDALKRLLEAQRQTAGAVALDATGHPCAGPAVVPGREVQVALGAGGAPEDAARRLIRSSSPLLASPEAYLRLDSQEAVDAADRRMYLDLACVADGYIDRVFNRHISRWFTRRVINLPITPNQVTCLHFSLGMLAAWLFWQGDYALSVVGAVLFQLSVALDCSDGEIARLKYQFSKFGSWLDVWADNVVTVAVFAAAARAAATQLGVPLATTLGVLAATGVVMCVLVIFGLGKLQSRFQPGSVSALAATNRLSSEDQVKSTPRDTLTEKVINEATSRDFSVIVVALVLIGRLEWLAWLAGIGSHVFWIVFSAIQLSMFRTANAESR